VAISVAAVITGLLK